MLTLRIDQVDMHLRDQRALEILKSKMNPHTQRAEITMRQLALELGCSDRGITRIAIRLESAGLIIRHRTRGRDGAEIEVLSNQGAK